MLSIRLSRVGKKKAPVYRIVVMPKHRDPWANFVEILGHYNPRKQPREIVIKADRVKYWLSEGAQATDTVWNLLIDEKIIEGKKRSASTMSKKRAAKIEEKNTATAKEKSETEAKAKAEADAAPAPEAEAPAKEAPAAEEKPTEEEKKDEAPAQEAKSE